MLLLAPGEHFLDCAKSQLVLGLGDREVCGIVEVDLTCKVFLVRLSVSRHLRLEVGRGSFECHIDALT